MSSRSNDALLHLLGDLRRLLDVDRLRCFLDEADDVAHAEDARSDALGMEVFERVPLFADADQLDRLAGDGAHRQCRAAAAIAVGTRQDNAGDADAAVEGLGGVDGILARQCVGDEQDFVRVSRGFDVANFVHQLFVDRRRGRRCRR